MPHALAADEKPRFRSLDFLLLLVWWIYLYVFTVMAWEYAAPNSYAYGRSYTGLAAVENTALVLGLLALTWHARSGWRSVYAHLLAAGALYAASAFIVHRAMDNNQYFTGSVYDVPLVASFV